MSIEIVGTPRTIGYIVSHEAWYRSVIKQTEIMVGDYGDGEDCTWEFGIRQVSNIGVRVEIYDDAWKAYTAIPELFARLAELERGSTLDDIRAILDGLGYTDRTERTSPYGSDTAKADDAKRRIAVQEVIGDVDDDTWSALRTALTNPTPR